MKLEYFFFALFALLLAATGMLAMHYRGELMYYRRVSEQARQAPAIPQAPVVPAAAASADPAVAERAALQRQLEQAESEKNLLANQMRTMESGKSAGEAVAGTEAPAAVVAAEPVEPSELTASQLRIKEAPAIAKVQQYLPDQGFAVIDAGSARGLKTGQVYAVRRGHYIVAKKVEVGETVEESQAILGVNSSALQPGETLKAGDEVIKWE